MDKGEKEMLIILLKIAKVANEQTKVHDEDVQEGRLLISQVPGPCTRDETIHHPSPLLFSELTARFSLPLASTPS
ncbi:hypothetical protein KQX54_014938 [Cotesia glomerata]|uniref:Uncharacterized protein n=1 Tax=Cotesia glomerata TaxID=32391 RepID=A0AAV7IJL6_COTGL|nr:hypothetical protein KQX54_014938 [Cotesia glomerata]